MTVCTWDAPGILEDCRVIRDARKDHNWRLQVEKCREMVPAMHRAAEIIETSWYDLSPEQQAEAVKIKRLVEEGAKRLDEEARGALDRIWRRAKAFWWGVNQTELMPYLYASVRFLVAVDRALANETRRRRSMERAMVNDLGIVAQIERGEADFSAGKITRYSQEEFARRFILT